MNGRLNTNNNLPLMYANKLNNISFGNLVLIAK